MSMFHELMMRKKEETMYLVIKGNLTQSPDGVFSGFSSANYLQLDNVLHETEIVVKFTTSSDITSRQLVISSARLIEISVWDSYIKTWNFQSSQTVSLFSIQANTTYWVKEKITSTTKTFSISTDGINYGNDITLNDNFGSGANTIKFGTHINNLGYGFLGSIDLNRSYIKLGSTKYKLQAVVGYTIVGSPTITDGVVSGFSSSNYLQLPSFNPNKLEMLFKVNTGTSTNVIRTLVNTSNNILVIRLRDVNKFEFGIGTANGNWNIANWISGSKTILANTDYWIKFIYNGNKYILSISENGQDFEDDIIVNNSTLFGTINNLILGTRGNVNWQGSIDLNETYIKINNKLWFNGQQA